MQGCGETGHWFRDRPECAVKVQEMDKSRRTENIYGHRKNQEYNNNRHIDGDKKVGAFSRPGGK